MDVSLKCEAASEEAQLSSACPSQDDVAGGCEQAIGPDACIVQPTETPASLILFGSTSQETPWEARPIGHVLYGYSRRHVRGSQRSSDHSSFIILWLRSVRARSLKHLQNLYPLHEQSKDSGSSEASQQNAAELVGEGWRGDTKASGLL